MASFQQGRLCIFLIWAWKAHSCYHPQSCAVILLMSWSSMLLVCLIDFLRQSVVITNAHRPGSLNLTLRRQSLTAGDVDNVAAIGHRVVHGRNINKAVLVDDGVIQAIKDASDLAPLHNPGKQLNPSHKTPSWMPKFISFQAIQQICCDGESQSHHESHSIIDSICWLWCSKPGGNPGCSEDFCREAVRRCI